METQIIIVAHHSRIMIAERLASNLNAKIFFDESNHGANWNHKRAIDYLATNNQSGIIIEDDAIPCKNFKAESQRWISRFSTKIISFYLGKGRPPQYQHFIKKSINNSIKSRLDYIEIDNLIHGVGYYLPSSLTKQIQANWNYSMPADFAVGRAYGKKVVYPIRSLLEHSDIESVEKHQDGQQRTEIRRAWHLLN